MAYDHWTAGGLAGSDATIPLLFRSFSSKLPSLFEGNTLVPDMEWYAHLAVSIAFAIPITACGTNPDPVAHGELCTPQRDDCAPRTTLSRENAGSNILDVAITNEGPPATILFDVDLTDPSDATGAGDAAPAEPPGGLFPVQYRLDQGETATDRFGPSEIFVRKRLRLRLGCRACEECSEPCRASLEYTYMTEPVACDNDDDCRGDRLCNDRTGTCVVCLDDGDCGDEQSCHSQSGRCLPPTSGGCSQTPAAPAPLPIVAFIGLGLVPWRRMRDTRSGGEAINAILGIALVAAVLAGMPSDARARAPDSTFSLSTGPRFVTGPLGSDVKRGIGAELHQALRWRHGGVDFWIETSYFVTTQEAPPLTRELQVFGFGGGPRAYVPIGSFELMAGAGYQRVGFGPNALVERTGPEANYHTVGGTVGVGYHFSPFVIRTDAQYFPIIGAEGAVLSVNVSFGVSTE